MKEITYSIALTLFALHFTFTAFADPTKKSLKNLMGACRNTLKTDEAAIRKEVLHHLMSVKAERPSNIDVGRASTGGYHQLEKLSKAAKQTPTAQAKFGVKKITGMINDAEILIDSLKPQEMELIKAKERGAKDLELREREERLAITRTLAIQLFNTAALTGDFLYHFGKAGVGLKGNIVDRKKEELDRAMFKLMLASHLFSVSFEGYDLGSPEFPSPQALTQDRINSILENAKVYTKKLKESEQNLDRKIRDTEEYLELFTQSEIESSCAELDQLQNSLREMQIRTGVLSEISEKRAQSFRSTERSNKSLSNSLPSSTNTDQTESGKSTNSGVAH